VNAFASYKLLCARQPNNFWLCYTK